MRKTTLSTAIITSLATSSTLYAAGFQIAERSTIGLGRAFSGEASIADDASIIASNPAGMVLLEDNAYSIGLNYINPEIDVEGTGVGSFPANDDDVALSAALPYIYYAKKVNPNLSVGFGTFVGYGLKTGYSKAFAARASVYESELSSINLNPSLAYRINDQLSVGAGFSLTYAEGKISSLTPGSGAPLFKLEGDDLAFSYNIGVLYELSESTRIGLSYRSSVDLSVEGTAELGAALGGPVTTPATLDIELPNIIELSVYHELNDQWAIHADVMHTGWSSFKKLSPKTGTAADAALETNENWSNSTRYAIGATYKACEKWTFRAGVAYDESPVSDEYRTLRIPDEDRIWVSLGASYKMSERYTVDVGYTHIFADEAQINANEHYFNGKASGGVNIFGIGLHGNF